MGWRFLYTIKMIIFDVANLIITYYEKVFCFINFSIDDGYDDIIMCLQNLSHFRVVL